MKNILYTILMILFLLGGYGCKTTEPAERSDPQILLSKAAAIRSAGGFAVVGTARSKLLSGALDKAVLNGQTKLASTVEARIDVIRQNFSKEVGEDNIDKFNELFYVTKDALRSKALKDVIPKSICYDTSKGITTAYALIILDPNLISQAFPSDAEQFRHTYTRFRASKAFSQMNNELKQYNIWKKETGSSFFW